MRSGCNTSTPETVLITNTPLTSRSVNWRLVLFAVVAISAVSLGWHLDRAWFPVDDGALAHSADRVLHGQLPHRDFDDVYTGGLSLLNAAAFRLLGASFFTMRLALFAVFLAWVPAVFYVASRFVRPVAAALVTLLAVAWSLPAYSAPMPSWYNLFLATFGIAALCRHLEARRARWLFVAGIAGGLSFLVKVVGLYFVAAVLLHIVFQAHADARRPAVHPRDRGTLYALFVSAAMLLFIAALATLVQRQLFAAEVAHYVLPGALLAGLSVRDEWTVPAGTSAARFAALGRLLAPFVMGLVIPVALFLVPYAQTGALGAFANGVFVLPMRRLGNASVHMLPLATGLSLLLPAALLAAGTSARGAGSRARIALLTLALALLVVATGGSTILYRLVWNSARMAVPALSVIGVVVLSRRRAADDGAPLLRSQTLLLLSAAALCSLVQFPFSVAIYFCYVAPLVALSAVALLRYAPQMEPAVPGMLAAFYLTFAVLRIDSAAQFGMGRFFLPSASVPFEPMAGERAGIEVPRVTYNEYQAVTYLLRAHAHGGYTWASPDSPEIYFLTGLRNPTRSLYEFFDDTTAHSARILAALDAHGVTAIVENRKPPFSAPLAPELLAGLEARYPHAAERGPYVVRWR